MLFLFSHFTHITSPFITQFLIEFIDKYSMYMHVCLFIHQYLMLNLLILDFNWSVKWWCRYQTVDVNLHAIFIRWWKMVRIRPFYTRSQRIAKCLSCNLCNQLLTDATKIIICFHTCENFYWSQKFLLDHLNLVFFFFFCMWWLEVKGLLHDMICHLFFFFY